MDSVVSGEPYFHIGFMPEACESIRVALDQMRGWTVRVHPVAARGRRDDPFDAELVGWSSAMGPIGTGAVLEVIPLDDDGLKFGGPIEVECDRVDIY